MLFRQMFDNVSGTFSYLLASRQGGEALIIDPVLEKVDRYVQLMRELDLRLVKAVDTHLHADHVTGLAELRDRTHCITVMGQHTKADVVSMRVEDGDKVQIEGVSLEVLYTPGHTDDSYSFTMADRVFTGDTLLIRGTGRTDFQNGDPRAQYESLFGRLLKLPDQTLVFPAHDYKGDTVSTIGEEKAWNPRLQVRSVDEYVRVMNSLNLPNPKMMDVAVPANMRSDWRRTSLRDVAGLSPLAMPLGFSSAEISCSSISGRAEKEPSTVSFPAPSTRPMRICRPVCARAACCISWPQARENRGFGFGGTGTGEISPRLEGSETVLASDGAASQYLKLDRQLVLSRTNKTFMGIRLDAMVESGCTGYARAFHLTLGRRWAR
jgi:glyoxylase-like metal-dependent hydrolase (beta-lactamase superfamily II)